MSKVKSKKSFLFWFALTNLVKYLLPTIDKINACRYLWSVDEYIYKSSVR
jgi:hypothetical protein